MNFCYRSELYHGSGQITRLGLPSINWKNFVKLSSKQLLWPYVIITSLSNNDCSEGLHCTRQWRWGVLIETSGDKLGFNIRHLAVSCSTEASSLCVRSTAVEIHSTIVFCVRWHLISSSSSTGQGLHSMFEAYVSLLRVKKKFLLWYVTGPDFPVHTIKWCCFTHGIVVYTQFIHVST